jgi:exodeoxyribonuclease VII large subunit
MMSVPLDPLPIQREIYSVSRLNREARLLLNISFPLLWVEGEVSNLAKPSSGHLYFTLKDDGAAVRCAMFKNHNLYLRFQPRDGMQVLVRARVGLYEPRGEFQLTIEHMEEAGFGALQRAFEILKRRLAAEGLFDPARKQAVPRYPYKVGIITSPVGAALTDILSVLRRRFPPLSVLIYPVPVQGEAAAAGIARALALASRRRDCDVLILARGGGSLEDLWAFNTEAVARAIAGCEIPVVSGVGHEIDFTIADFIADQRAPTPTAAAELVSPDQSDLLSWLDQVEGRLRRCLLRRCERCGQMLSWMRGRLHLQHPWQRLQRHSQRVDDLEQRLGLAMRYRLKACTEQLSGLDVRMQRCSPQVALTQTAARHERLAQRLIVAICRHMEARWARLDRLARILDTISPLATLDRGYALVTRVADSRLLRDSSVVTAGEALNIRLAKGGLRAKVSEHIELKSDAHEPK